MIEGVPAKALYKVIDETVGPAFELAAFARARKPSNTWIRTDGNTWLFLRTTVSRTQAFNPIDGGRFFFLTWRGSHAGEPAVPFQNQFDLNHLLNDTQRNKKKELRNIVIRKALEQRHALQSLQLALEASRPSLEAQLQAPELWNQEHGMPYLDLRDVERWARFLVEVFPTVHAELLTRRQNLADIAGSMLPDAEFDAIMAEQDQIDPEMWE